MNTEITKVQKIIDEIFIYMHKIGGKNIKIMFEEKPDSYIINIKSNFDEKNLKKITRLSKCLCIERQEEMEAYYWELAGNTSYDTELSLVGMMTDDVSIIYSDDVIEIEMLRLKPGVVKA